MTFTRQDCEHQMGISYDPAKNAAYIPTSPTPSLPEKFGEGHPDKALEKFFPKCSCGGLTGARWRL